VVAVSVEDSPRRVLDVVISEGYSKLPVYQESKDDIVGVVHDRELLVALANGSLAHVGIRALMRPAVHVPETKKIAELLREMQRGKFSLAIVVDEYGGTAGLVTMEDLLEEIVGEIRDEHDLDEQEPIAVISDCEAVVEAGTNIEDVNARLGTELPTEDFETIGGYTVGLFGRLPTEGEEVAADDHTRLRVDRTRGRRILAVRVYTNGSIAIPQQSEDSDAAAHL
jgi:CBS domain containing-hemolysin-like protein